MTNEVERALQAAIRADPDDWAAWLVYADWLAERGDVRGQLIAWEHQLATAPGGELEGTRPESTALSDDERRALRAQIEELEQRHRREWLLGWDPPRHVRPHWRHGFITGASLTSISDGLAALDPLLAHPAAWPLARLDLSDDPLDAGDIRALADRGALRSLTALYLDDTGLGDDGVRALAAVDSLRSLAVLTLASNDLGDPGVCALAAADNLPSLNYLGLSTNRIGPEGARALAAMRSLGSLVRLDLSFNRLGPEGARALAGSESLRSLRELVLTGNAIGAEGHTALTGALPGCRLVLSPG